MQGRKKASASALEGVEDFFPPNFHRQAVSGGVAPEMSGKFMVLDRLLREVRATTDDRCVLISNYTQVWGLMGRGDGVGIVIWMHH